MGKGSWRRPNGPDFDVNYCKVFPNSRGCVAARNQAALDEQRAERQERAEFVMQRAAERAQRVIALTLDELRTIVFETSVAYSNTLVKEIEAELDDQQITSLYVQEAEWARAAALKAGLERLGYEREAEMIGGAA